VLLFFYKSDVVSRVSFFLLRQGVLACSANFFWVASRALSLWFPLAILLDDGCPRLSKKSIEKRWLCCQATSRLKEADWLSENREWKNFRPRLMDGYEYEYEYPREEIASTPYFVQVDSSSHVQIYKVKAIPHSSNKQNTRPINMDGKFRSESSWCLE